MNSQTSIVTLTPENLTEYGCPCFLNPKNEGHLKKLAWLKERFSEGLTIKYLFIEGEKKHASFIEYVPGEYVWRAVDASGYMFIHCIWTSPNKNKEKGYSSLLIEDCVNAANQDRRYGVTVVASDGPFIAGKEIFLKNGFEIVAKNRGYDLLVKRLGNGPSPKFTNREDLLSRYKGLNILYSKQCPWVARSIDELLEIAGNNNVEVKITEMETAEAAQNAPSVYSVFNLIYDGRLIIDHYISTTRFLNILRKELKLIS